MLATGALALIAGCSPAVAPTPKPVFQATIHLQHVPAGFVTLAWNSANGLIHLTLATYGLAVKSTHGTDLRQGPCTQSDSPMVSTFSDVTADAHGGVQTTITSADSTAKPPDAHFDVLLGASGASSPAATRIACAQLPSSNPTGPLQLPGRWIIR